MTVSPDMTPYRTHEIDRVDHEGDDKKDAPDKATRERVAKEMQQYLAFPKAEFTSPETGDSFTYHSPAAVSVFFHVPRRLLNWISIGKVSDFLFADDSKNLDRGDEL